MTLLHTLTHPSRLHDLSFTPRVSGEGELLLAAAEDKKTSIYDLYEDTEKAPEIIATMIGHTNRSVSVSFLIISL
jgi:protein MAK11